MPDSTYVISQDSLRQLIKSTIKDTSQSTNSESYFFTISIIGLACCLLGFIIYIRIWKKHRDELPHKNFFRSAPYIVAYTPSGDVTGHILGGLLFTAGLGVFIGYSIGYLTKSDVFTYHSSAIGVSSTIFSIFTCIITFWTLNQTKRIEHQQGHKIVEFGALIRRMNQELERMKTSYTQDYDRVAQDFHRIYIVTEHIFFGTMSFPNERFTIELLENYNTFKTFVRDGGNFSFHIICADAGLVGNYIEKYNSNINDAGIKNTKIEEAKKKFETDIKDFVDCNIATRVKEVPPFPQFAIIGNTIFEFIIQAQNPQTKIIETNVINDRARCKLYIETFNLLKERLPKA